MKLPVKRLEKRCPDKRESAMSSHSILWITQQAEKENPAAKAGLSR